MLLVLVLVVLVWGKSSDDATMLKAYTTYSITVVAESDEADSSEESEPITVTTAQK